MKKLILGRSGIEVSATGFGALPVQRVTMDEAKEILVAAHRGGITLFDTARVYSDSEEKLGNALSDVRGEIVLATKTMAHDAAGFWRDLEASLRLLKTDYIDIYQFHNPPFVPVPGGDDGLYDAMLEAKAKGVIRAIGITQHSLERAFEAVGYGLYDTLQYPFNHLATEREVELMELCGANGVGFIAMKALSGGLITDVRLPMAYIGQYGHVVPIWGIQRMAELEEVLGLASDPPEMGDEMREAIERDRRQLSGAFCRGCGYCLPCPAGIPINNANRMKHLMTRSPVEPYLTEEWRVNMDKIANCTKCGLCEKRCPYGLKPYETLGEHLRFYCEMVEKLG